MTEANCTAHGEEMVRLREEEKMSYAKIAKRFNLSVPVARTRMINFYRMRARGELCDLPIRLGNVLHRFAKQHSLMEPEKSSEDSYRFDKRVISVIPKITCEEFLNARHIGRPSLLTLLTWLKDHKASLGCGCPQTPCVNNQPGASKVEKRQKELHKQITYAKKQALHFQERHERLTKELEEIS